MADPVTGDEKAPPLYDPAVDFRDRERAKGNMLPPRTPEEERLYREYHRQGRPSNIVNLERRNKKRHRSGI